MKTTLSKNYYQHAQVEQQERLHAFRTTHPREQIDLSGTTWSYLLGARAPRLL